MSAERIYKKKSKENFDVAKSCKTTHPNASASRLYYALFQGAIGEFEKLNIQPQQIDRGAADAMEDRGVKWTHSFVRNNCRMIGLDPDQCNTIREALALRTLADYSTTEVDKIQLEEVVRRATDILESLGVIS